MPITIKKISKGTRKISQTEQLQRINAETGFGPFNPMLAAEAELGNITYPIYASPKHNGVRGCVQNGVLLGRSLKPIPNLHTQTLFSHGLLNGLEGELVVGAFNDENVFVNSQSGVGTVEGTPAVKWYIFDQYDPHAVFNLRLATVQFRVSMLAHPDIEMIPYKLLNSDEELEAYSEEVVAQGYEGLVLRKPTARYKTGRSTDKEQGFMRYCGWLKSEAKVLRFEEGQINNNESTINELGFKKKSSHKANKVGSGRSGKMVVQDLKTGLIHKMPVPTVKLQDETWQHPEKYVGELSHYKFKPPVKAGGLPRFPQHLGFRSPDDMS